MKTVHQVTMRCWCQMIAVLHHRIMRLARLTVLRSLCVEVTCVWMHSMVLETVLLSEVVMRVGRGVAASSSSSSHRHRIAALALRVGSHGMLGGRPSPPHGVAKAVVGRSTWWGQQQAGRAHAKGDWELANRESKLRTNHTDSEDRTQSWKGDKRPRSFRKNQGMGHRNPWCNEKNSKVPSIFTSHIDKIRNNLWKLRRQHTSLTRRLWASIKQ